MKTKGRILFLLLILVNSPLSAQLVGSGYTNHGYNYTLYDFRVDHQVKAKYFAQNAYTQYQRWQYGKEVMLICSGAFSETWEVDSKPVGFTVDNGVLVNYSMDDTMDGLVMVMDGKVVIIDLDNLKSGITLDDGRSLTLNPRMSSTHRALLKDVAVKFDYTIFQTQLLYSKDKVSNFGNPYYGKKAERRFLAICSKGSYFYNVIVDTPNPQYLNLAAKYAKEVLDYAGYVTYYMLNLDTGGKNIFLIRKNSQELKYLGDDPLEKATNLIVFYK